MLNIKSDILKVAILQSDLVWEDIDANLANFQHLLTGLERDIRLVVLPEMFAMGFSMNPSGFQNEELWGVFDWMRQEAKKHDIILAGSSIAPAKGGYFNRFMLVFPDGKTAGYDKRHLFRMGEEQKHYLPGNSRVIVDLEGWRTSLMICYDLRFPVWSRNRNDSDLLIYVANWPAPRKEAWLTLLKARAIENQCYVIGANRIGKDPYTTYVGNSVVLSPRGDVLNCLPEGNRGVVKASLDRFDLDEFRKLFPVWKDADNFSFEE